MASVRQKLRLSLRLMPSQDITVVVIMAMEAMEDTVDMADMVDMAMASVKLKLRLSLRLMLNQDITVVVIMAMEAMEDTADMAMASMKLRPAITTVTRATEVDMGEAMDMAIMVRQPLVQEFSA